MTSLTRRLFLRRAGTAAVAASAVSVPAIVAARSEPAPADAVLIAAGLAWERAVSAFREAEERHEQVTARYVAARGTCPKALFVEGDDEWELAEFRGRFSWMEDAVTDDGTPCLQTVWRLDGLEKAIKAAPSILGQGGRTPFVIRRLRGLMPVAAAWERRKNVLSRRYRLDALYDVLRAAREAADSAETPILEAQARTMEGVAVKARLAAYKLAEWSKWDSGIKQSSYLLGVVEAAVAVGGSSARAGEA